MHQALGLVIRREDGDYFDSFQGIRRQGCRLSAEGSFADLGQTGGPVTILETAFRRHGWRGDLRYMADGPDGSDVGLRRLDRLCLVLGRWDGGDDGEDTTSTSPAEPQGRFQTTLECARDVPSNRDAGVPDSIWNPASRAGLDSIYAISLALQYPPYLEGDFDGDGANDAAVLVEHRLSGKLGIAILRRGAGRITILSAGDPGPGPDDLSWIDGWDIYRKGTTNNLTIQDRPAVRLGADALWVGRRDSVSAFYVWTGSDYVWEGHRK
jgi:hypothetical protein